MSSMREHGITETAIQDTMDSVNGSAYTILSNECDNSSKQSGRRYSKELMNLALTIHYLSPRCYKFLRGVFALPSEVSIRKMLASVDGSPGFTLQAMHTLRNVQEQSTNKVFWTLMLDCMSIKSQISYNKHDDSNSGYTDIGNAKTTGEEKDAATQSLTFMCAAMNKHIKLTVGYFLVKKLSAPFQASLIKECLQLLHENGIQISAIVCDGAAVNKSSLTMLGASLSLGSLRGDFPHPATGKKVIYIPDVCHNIKLMRNLLADKEELTYNTTGKV